MLSALRNKKKDMLVFRSKSGAKSAASSFEEENREKWGRKRERGGRRSARDKKEDSEGEGCERVGRKKKKKWLKFREIG